ncbi:enoyl-CoA hydratase/isomerase family protein [Castellaniella sp.]|uniref:enoyl-CoA hydratase/isomerase family protein n=1 Tax=Castellaniella sp. TaxID=1955812 RepID=UPI003C738F4F
MTSFDLQEEIRHVAVDRPEPHIARVMLQGRSRYNLMSYAMLRELWAVANRLQGDADLRVVIVSGLPDAFSAGMDLKQAEVAGHRALSTAERLEIHSIGARACAAWESLDAVTVCAIEGYCLGGGLAFSLACDYRVASSGAMLGAPELRNGMNMSWQSIPRLVALIGQARTRKLLMLGDPVDAQTAERWGLVDELSDPGDAQEKALLLARRLASMPPVPMRMTKQAINVAANALGHAVSYMDLEQYVACQSTDEHQQALDAFFQRR